MIDDRTPVLIGAGQLTQRDVEPAEAKEPLAMMVEVARRAAADAGAQRAPARRLDSVAVVNILELALRQCARACWPSASAPAGAADLHHRRRQHAAVRWSTRPPHRIAAGEVRLALIAGAEAVRTPAARAQGRRQAALAAGGDGTPTIVGDDALGHNATDEMIHGLQHADDDLPALRERAARALRR